MPCIPGDSLPEIGAALPSSGRERFLNMKKLRNLVIIGLFAAIASPYLPGSGWKAGAASVCITPRESMWMAGYAARSKPSEGKIHELYARAVALQDGSGNRLVILSTEVIGILREDRDWLERELGTAPGLKPEEFLVNVSHTHSGPELRVDKAVLYGIPDEQVEKSRIYREAFRRSLAEAARKALADMVPVTLDFSSARAGFAMNRRLKTDQGYVIAPNSSGPVDHQVPVMKITGQDDSIKALLFGYACHATVMDFYKFSGDWPGFAQHEIEKRFPGCTAMFINGCSADQNPTPRRRLELAEHYGETIANAVEAAILAQQEPVKGPLRVRLAEINLRFENIPGLRELEAMRESGDKYDVRRANALLAELEAKGSIHDTYPYLVQVVEFGDSLILAALSGEVVVDYSLRLKQEISSRRVWVAGYSNDVMGYIPSRRVQEEGGYEGGGALRYSTLPGTWGCDTEDLIVAKIKNLAGQADR